MGSANKLYVNKNGELCQRIDSKYHNNIQLVVLGFSCQDWTEKPNYSRLLQEEHHRFIKPFGKPRLKQKK